MKSPKKLRLGLHFSGEQHVLLRGYGIEQVEIESFVRSWGGTKPPGIGKSFRNKDALRLEFGDHIPCVSPKEVLDARKGIVTEGQGSMEARHYDPMQEEQLVDEFAELWRKGHAATIEFANMYGQLTAAGTGYRAEPLQMWEEESFKFFCFLRALRLRQSTKGSVDIVALIEQELGPDWELFRKQQGGQFHSDATGNSLLLYGEVETFRVVQANDCTPGKNPYDLNSAKGLGSIIVDVLNHYASECYQVQSSLQQGVLRIAPRNLLGAIYAIIDMQATTRRIHVRFCEFCRKPLAEADGAPARSNRRFCDAACKQGAFRRRAQAEKKSGA